MLEEQRIVHFTGPFRLNEIRVHVDATESWTGNGNKILLRLLKELDTKPGEMSRVFEGRSTHAINNWPYAVLRH
jgi:hypothetical protein